MKKKFKKFIGLRMGLFLLILAILYYIGVMDVKKQRPQVFFILLERGEILC